MGQEGSCVGMIVYSVSSGLDRPGGSHSGSHPIRNDTGRGEPFFFGIELSVFRRRFMLRLLRSAVFYSVRSSSSVSFELGDVKYVTASSKSDKLSSSVSLVFGFNP